MQLMYGLSNTNKFICVELVHYPAPPTNLYIYPREGWHLLARSGQLDYKGQPYQDASFQRQFVSLDYDEALTIIDASFSRVEQMYHDLLVKMLKESHGYMRFKTTTYQKKESNGRKEFLYSGR